jgi:hypothetical protein
MRQLTSTALIFRLTAGSLKSDEEAGRAPNGHQPARQATLRGSTAIAVAVDAKVGRGTVEYRHPETVPTEDAKHRQMLSGSEFLFLRFATRFDDLV